MIHLWMFPGYCWIGLLDCSIRIAIQFGVWIVIDNPNTKLDFGFGLSIQFVVSIQIQNIIIIFSKNQNFEVHNSPTMKPSYFLSKFSNNLFI